MNDLINIGKIVAPFGLKGEAILQHSLGKKTILKDVETIFIETQKNSFLPYFVQSSKAKSNNEIYLKLEGIDVRETVQKLLQKKVWLHENDFRKLAAKNSSIALIGFTLINDKNKLGVIEEVIEQPHQTLLRISVNNKEVLIPLHEETLAKVDHKKKEVHVILPDGLLEIYT